MNVEFVAACLSYDRAVAQAACEAWAAAPEPEQRAVLTFADPAGLSLHLWSVAQRLGVADRLAHAAEYRERRRKNEIRLAKRRRHAAEVVGFLATAGLRAAVLKGFLLAPDFVPSAADRQQNDIDLLLSPEDARRALSLLLDYGYRIRGEEHDGPAVHLPML